MGILSNLKKLILILIIIFSFSLVYGQTTVDVSKKLSDLTQPELSEVSTQIDTIKVRTNERLIEFKDSINGQLLQKFQTFNRDGKKISGRTIEWSYYPGEEGKRPVDIITIKELDSNDKVMKVKKIKHWPDGRVEEIK